MIEFDQEFMVPLNVHIYSMDFAKANANPDYPPEWKKLYDWKTEYNLKDLSPSSMQEFAIQMQNDAELSSRFRWNSDRRAYPYEVEEIPDQCLLSSEEYEWKDC